MTSSKLTLRRARPRDAKSVWHIANSPSVRRQSKCTQPFSLAHHCIWFDRKVRDTDSRLYVAEVDQQIVAYVRFDAARHNSLLANIAVRSKYRGKGIGVSALQRALIRVRRELSPTIIHAQVVKNNQASKKIFEQCGFTRDGSQNGCINYVF